MTKPDHRVLGDIPVMQFLDDMFTFFTEGRIGISVLQDEEGNNHHVICFLKPLNEARTAYDSLPVARILTRGEVAFLKPLIPIMEEGGEDDNSEGEV